MVDVEGVGLQINPTLLNDLDPDTRRGLSYDFAELLCDSFAGALDSGYVIHPLTRPLLEQLQAAGPVVAHGNYGAEFGFEALEETPAVRRHIAACHAMKSPWYADHMFYGDLASSYMWSSPLQFSRKEIERVAGRAAKLQDLLGVPLLHENAFYYAPFPGSTMAEVEFIAEVLTKAQTFSLLDLHNVYANSVNFKGYDRWHFLRTLPLDRVIEIHIAGGQQIDETYHDFHNFAVPEPVWEMLEWVVPRASSLKAICLEVQGPEHNSRSRPLGPEWRQMMENDLLRAKSIWSRRRALLP